MMACSKTTNSDEFQKFLDTNQYSVNGILRYEKIFGKDYVSVGGETTTAKFCLDMNLERNQKVLDIGCGIGGSAFYMASHYGVDVYGIDLAKNMINIANDKRESSARSSSVKHRCQFHVSDATIMDYPENFYDVVYSRDTILHIEDKLSLFKLFYKTLKPGGTLLITDYCMGGGNQHSQHFKDYVKQRGYVLTTVEEYGAILEEAGFGDVEANDVTDYFIQVSENELAKYQGMKDSLLSEGSQFAEENFNDICQGWKEKIARAKSGDQAWGMFKAKKLYA